jgi:sugar phosphate isomerase/epimerase
MSYLFSMPGKPWLGCKLPEKRDHLISLRAIPGRLGLSIWRHLKDPPRSSCPKGQHLTSPGAWNLIGETSQNGEKREMGLVAFPELCARAYTLEDIRYIRKLGLKAAEINLLRGEGIFEDLSVLRSLGAELGISYVVHGPNEGDPCDLRKLGGSFFERILAIMDASLEIGARVLTVHFWMDRRFIPREVVSRKAEILERMALEGEKRGLILCLENLSEDPQDLRLALEISPFLGLTLDVGHGQLMSSRNRALELLEAYPTRVKHVHIHDNRGGSLVEDDLHLPVGEGCVDFESFFQALMRRGYRGLLSLEVSSDALDESIRRVRVLLQEARRKATHGN